MEKAKLSKEGYAMIIFYFLSLDKPEFTEYAKKLSSKTERVNCFNLAWWMVMGRGESKVELQKLNKFLREHCKRNKFNLTEWFKTQRKVKNHLKQSFLHCLLSIVFKSDNSQKVIDLY